VRPQRSKTQLERVSQGLGYRQPRIAVECDSGNSLLIEVEAGHGIALSTPIFKLVTVEEAVR